MPQYSANANSWTPTATADTTNLADNTHFSVQGGSGTQICKFVEIYMGGEASASSLNIMIMARHSTVGATLTSLTTKQSYTPQNFASVAGTAKPFVAATTKPQSDVARHLLDLSFNAFGGLVRWVAAPGSEIYTVGNTASGGEVGLNGFTGATSGQMSAHFILEEV